MTTIRLTLPPICKFDKTINQNKIKQLLVPAESADFTIHTFSQGRLTGYTLERTGTETMLVIKNNARVPEQYAYVLKISEDISENAQLKWMKHPAITGEEFKLGQENQRVLRSWVNTLTLSMK